ncbi:MAG TPA: PEP-CTERM sorting domain-containing protein [Thermoguttaceae bacterium]|nr:PEP-CTERM sorting domain-containing protein [Thermoguttaceae bacterium]
MTPQSCNSRWSFAQTVLIALAIAFSATFPLRADSTDGPLPSDELHGQIIGDLPAEPAKDLHRADEGNLVTAADHSAWDTLNENSSLPLQGGLPDPNGEELNELGAEEDGGGLSLIPEPSTMLMLVLAGLTVYLWRLKW